MAAAKGAVYGGTIKCSGMTKTGKECTLWAYFASNDTTLCGMHSKKDTERKELPKMPEEKRREADAKRLRAHAATVAAAAAENKAHGRQGSVSCHKLLMMKNPPLVDGHLNVFPNFKHQGAFAARNGGVGYSKLSPKAMGPVKHGQPGLPDAENIENMHQGNKVFPCFVGKEAAFAKIRKAMYEDAKPYRHQHDFWADHPELVPADVKLPAKKENAPAHSVWITAEGERKFTYVESRQFYCHFYEKIALASAEFKELKSKIDNGTNVIICGYDAYPPVSPGVPEAQQHAELAKTLEKHYLDGSRPFGHELVLYTLLTTVPTPASPYPWQKHRSKNRDGSRLALPGDI